ncbi:hypothetical protein, partial [Hymenobacter aquaticus]|uniref:hypothetical protein n=1 Tax=Hymenobacter aquaticus TaxID=1867101 RepID=UPI001AEC4B84
YEKRFLPLQPASEGRGRPLRPTDESRKNKVSLSLANRKRLLTFATPNGTALDKKGKKIWLAQASPRLRQQVVAHVL